MPYFNDSKFRVLLINVLSRSSLQQAHINKILTRVGVGMYKQAFTHQSVDRRNNYEHLEFLGDSTLTKAISWYLASRFPQFLCRDGVQVLNRLKINLISKRSFAKFSRVLGFEDFIRVSDSIRAKKMTSVLEDVFEAFFAATELLVDKYIGMGVGYSVCYTLVKNILDQEKISLQYEKLVDARTRFKELIDSQRQLGKVVYKSTKNTEAGVHVSRIILDGVVIGTGAAHLKADADQKASEDALKTLAKRGVPIGPPERLRKILQL